MSHSLRGRLLMWLGAAIFGVATLAAVFTFYSAFDEAHELQDDLLRQIAGLYDETHLPPPHGDHAGRSPYSDEAMRIEVGLLPRDGTSEPGWFPPGLGDGMHTRRLGGASWRIFVRTLGNGSRVAVSQEVAVRDELAIESALLVLLPFALLVPVLFVAVALILRRSFVPVTALAAQVDLRTDADLQALDPQPAPREFQPFVIAINRLLGRVSQAMTAQQRFIADAAHELRTPLTALSLQSDRLGATELSSVAAERLATLRGGIERCRALLEQLLAMARAQAAAGVAAGATDVETVVRALLEDLVPMASARQIDLGVRGGCEGSVLAGATELGAVLRNLLDNAIRYTPRGGRIDIATERLGERLLIVIEDSGPGIPRSERERVFDPFYRVPGNSEPGSGLGLSIVGALLARLGGRIELQDAAWGSTGLRVLVELPAAARSAQQAR